MLKQSNNEILSRSSFVVHVITLFIQNLCGFVKHVFHKSNFPDFLFNKKKHISVKKQLQFISLSTMTSRIFFMNLHLVF